MELARRGHEAALRGDLDAVREILDSAVKWHGSDRSDPTACHNREQALAAMRQAFARQGIGELVDVLGAGEKVVVIIRPPSEDGEQAPPVANLTTFRDGRAVKMVHYSDPEDALAAVGLSEERNSCPTPNPCGPAPSPSTCTRSRRASSSPTAPQRSPSIATRSERRRSASGSAGRRAS